MEERIYEANHSTQSNEKKSTRSRFQHVFGNSPQFLFAFAMISSRFSHPLLTTSLKPMKYGGCNAHSSVRAQFNESSTGQLFCVFHIAAFGSSSCPLIGKRPETIENRPPPQPTLRNFRTMDLQIAGRKQHPNNSPCDQSRPPFLFQPRQISSQAFLCRCLPAKNLASSLCASPPIVIPC